MTGISPVVKTSVTPTPKFGTIDTWVALSGISRRTTYELLGRGHLQARKVNTRTLINIEHGLAWLEAQPQAKIKPQRTNGTVLGSAQGVSQRIYTPTEP